MAIVTQESDVTHRRLILFHIQVKGGLRGKNTSHVCREIDGVYKLLGLKPIASPFTINVVRQSYKKSHNLTLQLHRYTMGIPRNGTLVQAYFRM